MNQTQGNSVRKRGPKGFLWYIAFLVVLPAWGYGLGTGFLPLALLGLPIFVALLYLSFAKLVCPECGKATRAVGTKLTHCPFCGTAFDMES
jgi:hypothetical protein